ncbi:lytic transglycosylase domain-containing protein [Bacteroidia bacterium]|jgi:membrane-bound lytic murein transglycosylase D|nr:lytic transglycosylase domain-containing protein [Bacteroidota bacterium]MDA9111044.1 lytic transglycosylase domain-containing protein [Bacteroidia bacterium]
MIKNLSLLLITCFSVYLLFTAQKASENEEQQATMEKGQQIYPVPIPNEMTFGGELVPLNKYGVKERLDRELLANTYWQSNMVLLLKRSKRAFAVIEPILAENGLPDDLKYLAVAESGLVNATSAVGAKGVWQFMPRTAKSYGLRVNDQADERLNLEKSTRAACQYLKEAYDHFGNWSLAAASYNQGRAATNRDMAKQKVTDYYDLHLNTETSRYMLRILALKQIMSNPNLYGFHIADKDYYASPAFKTIEVTESIANLSEYAQAIGTNYHILKSMNPWIKGNELLVTAGSYKLKAPLQ